MIAESTAYFSVFLGTAKFSHVHFRAFLPSAGSLLFRPLPPSLPLLPLLHSRYRIPQSSFINMSALEKSHESIQGVLVQEISGARAVQVRKKRSIVLLKLLADLLSVFLAAAEEGRRRNRCRSCKWSDESFTGDSRCWRSFYRPSFQGKSQCCRARVVSRALGSSSTIYLKRGTY